MTTRIDVAVVGAGIVGLATAFRLLEARPDLRVGVYERAAEVATGQSSRNSGVLHAGVYYPPGSAKARWCREGKAQFERFAEEHGIPVLRTGKLIAAVHRRELPGLRRLVDRARSNGVEIVELDAAGVREHEPHVTAVAGAWTPETAVTDFAVACRRFVELIEERGGTVTTSCEVLDLEERHDGVRLRTAAGDVQASAAVVCAGVRSDRMARRAGFELSEQIVPFRGSWLRLADEKTHLVRGSIYPVPLAGLPFLGVHLTRRIDGQVWIGPNAMLALARQGDDPWSVDLRDLAETLRFPGLWRLGRRHLGAALGELWRDRLIAANVREVQRYVPEITVKDVERGPWGVRAQLMSREGDLVDDFVVRDSARVVHVLNAPSPAATSSLAIGADIRDRTLARLTG